jgi:[protein-PII] uridylyltransferase
VETLSILTLHTFVDSLATSDKLWNGFKDSLLWTLHSKARRLMIDGEEFLKAEDRQREVLMSEVRRKLPSHISPEELEAHFISLPPRYFNVYTVKEVLGDLEVAHQFMHRQIEEAERALSPVVSWQDEPNRGYNTVRVCTWDRMRLFVKIAGSFSAAGLSILTAQIFTRADGIVLDTFFVVDARTGALAGPEQREQFGAVLEKALTGTDVDFRTLIRKQHIVRPSYVAYLGEQMPTSIRFDNESSERRTVIEIETEDRVGLLFVISQSLAKLGLDISTARIQTEKGAAIDSFYVRDTNRQKVLSAERQKVIERELRAGIHQLDEPVKASREKA